MKKFAQILNGKAHYIFEAEEFPSFSPEIEIVEITNLKNMPEEGWTYSGSEFKPNQEPKDAALSFVRKNRDRLLSQSDWTQLPDAELTDKQKSLWAKYRKLLRSFPENCDPHNPKWPEIPG